jgi:N-acyl-L-homoserine lactone synthetase
MNPTGPEVAGDFPFANPLGDFSLKRVDPNDSTMRAVWRLRYEVYCLETHFLEPGEFPDHQERDAFDDHATHFAIMDGGGAIVAGLRLVRNNPLGFPLERHARSLSDYFRGLPRSRTMELSRFVVSKEHRIRQFHLMAALFRCAMVEGIQRGAEYALAAMEPGLCRLLKRFGYEFVEIGEPMEYYGNVVPYVMSVDGSLRNLANHRISELRFLIAGSRARRRPKAPPSPAR